jgi:hypothetical protein
MNTGASQRTECAGANGSPRSCRQAARRRPTVGDAFLNLDQRRDLRTLELLKFIPHRVHDAISVSEIRWYTEGRLQFHLAPDVSLIRGFSRKNNMRGDIRCHEKPDQHKAHLLVGAQQGRTKNNASTMSTHNVAIPWMFLIHFAPDRVHRKVQIRSRPQDAWAELFHDDI